MVAAGACGGRTGLKLPPETPPEPECQRDSDCKGFDDLCAQVICEIIEDRPVDSDAGPVEVRGICQPLPEVDCDDGDPCTTDLCAPATGACSSEPSTLDNDGDRHRAPKPGTLPGDPDACGDDCDDTSAAAQPGGTEVCDGVDNDCNGVVDDGALFEPVGVEVRVSGDIAPASPGGLAYSGESYLATYSGGNDGFDVYFALLDETGGKLPPGEQTLTTVNADGSGGPTLWIGDRYGVAWQDRRFDDYEVFFTALKATGEKAFPDLRLSTASGFSVNVSLVYNGAEFVAVWQDARSGGFELFAQRVSIDAQLVGNNVQLTSGTGLGNEAPAVAAGKQGIGVAWGRGDSLGQVIQFQVYDTELTTVGGTLGLTIGDTQSVYPTVTFNQDRYIIAWYDKSASPKGIWGAVVSEQGELLVPATPISQPGPFRSRYPFLRPLGDRVLAIYSDDRDQNDGYEIYAHMLNNDLSEKGPETRLTFAAGNSISPLAAFGPNGTLGVLFKDEREGGVDNIWFTGLGCVEPQSPPP
jgi:hypothetical protein